MRRTVRLAGILVASSACGDPLGGASALDATASLDVRSYEDTAVTRADAVTAIDAPLPTDTATSRDVALLDARDAVVPDAVAPDVLDAHDATTAPTDGGATTGCGATGVHAGDVTRTIMSGGAMRTYLVHVPTGYDASHAVELVINHHGYLSGASQQAAISHMSTAADTRGLIVVYPQGLDQSWDAGLCCGNSLMRGIDDVGFIRDVVAAMSRDYCIDAHRVFATGYSNGGFMAHRLACELSDRFAAIASVSGVNGAPTCHAPRHVPVLQIHGTADMIVPYNGGGFLGLYNYPSVATSMQGWATRDGCPSATSTLLQHGDVTCVTHGRCLDESEVILCTVQNGGHQWPGGMAQALLGNTSNDLDATSYILDFFDRHPLP